MALPAQDPSGLVGMHFIHTYAPEKCTWEMYVRNATTIDYRALSGRLRGHHVTGRTVDLARLDTDLYALSWADSIGCFSLTIHLGRRYMHAVIAILRDTGSDPAPVCRFDLTTESREITFLENHGPDSDGVLTAVPCDIG
ncbi:phenolic acid decarboxylase [Nocardia transvalensis]|nr:phenolic acid decarboxylase [Nocardia transvalensis]